MRIVPVAVAVLACAVAAGCSSSDDEARITRSAAASVKERTDGKLVHNPSLLSAKDIAARPEGSPERTFMTLWFYAQWGSAPSLVALYDKSVERELGANLIADVYVANRPFALQTYPKIVGVRRTPRGSLVLVELLSKESPPRPEGFLMRRVGKRWRIVHDTFLEMGVGSSAQAVVQERIDPDAKKVARRARIRGARARRQYRELLLPRRRSRQRPTAPSPSPVPAPPPTATPAP